MITRDTIDKIMDAARVEDVVGEHVTLKKRGANLLGLCPFHHEKTPSFTVSPTKNIYKCFGCGASGDSVKFLMEHEHLTYPEALRKLAQRYGVEVEETHSTAEENKVSDEKESLFIALNYATTFFENNLHNEEEGIQIGLSYFKERGFLDSTIQKFRLGYSLASYDAFYQKATKDQYSLDVLIKAGLVKEKEGRYFDFFRERVIFPIHNATGKIVAFGGRILKKNEKSPKYINTPETPVYHKSNVLYGLYQARNEIKKLDFTLLVEGYTDVISLHQAGIENVVASSGTSLTEEQVRLLKRYSNYITILYDGDQAGIKAALRGIDIILENDMNVKVVALPPDEDPDSYVKKVGAEDFSRFIEKNSKDFIFFKAGILLQEVGNDPIKKTEAIREIISSIVLIKDPIKWTLYVKELSKIFDMDENVIMSEVNKKKRNQTNKQYQSETPKVEAPENLVDEYFERKTFSKVKPTDIKEAGILKLLLEFGDQLLDDTHSVSEYVFTAIGNNQLLNEEYHYIFEKVKEMQGQSPKELMNHFLRKEKEHVVRVVTDIISEKYNLSENWALKFHLVVKTPGFDLRNEVQSLINSYLLERLQHLIKESDEALKNTGNDDRVLEIIHYKNQLIQAKKKLCDELGIVVVPKGR